MQKIGRQVSTYNDYYNDKNYPRKGTFLLLRANINGINDVSPKLINPNGAGNETMLALKQTLSSSNDIDGTLLTHLKTLVDQILLLQSTSRKNQEFIETFTKNEASHKDADKKTGANIQTLGLGFKWGIL